MQIWPVECHWDVHKNLLARTCCLRLTLWDPSKAAQPKCTDIEKCVFFCFFAHYSSELFKTTLDS